MVLPILGRRACKIQAIYRESVSLFRSAAASAGSASTAAPSRSGLVRPTGAGGPQAMMESRSACPLATRHLTLQGNQLIPQKSTNHFVRDHLSLLNHVRAIAQAPGCGQRTSAQARLHQAC
jgi:hypothetical protein